MLRTGVTWKRGRLVWYACLTYEGRTYSRTAETCHGAIAALEEAVNRHSRRPVYLFNF